MKDVPSIRRTGGLFPVAFDAIICENFYWFVNMQNMKTQDTGEIVERNIDEPIYSVPERVD